MKDYLDLGHMSQIKVPSVDEQTGAETEELAMELQKNLVEVFAKGQFEFRKWSSNSEKLLASIPVDHRYTQPVTLIEQESEQTKGPTFLRQPENTWPVEGTRCPASCPEEEVEQKRITLLTQVVDDECRVLRQSDNLSKVLRLTAYLLRIVDRLRKKTIPHWTSPPTTEETDRALRSLIRWTQQAFFEDVKKALSAVLHQVEATLNSRPLSAMSSDPSDYMTLTAGHFLTLEPLVTIPSPKDVADLVTMSSHKRWSLIQQIQYHFWTRWKNEYLHTLQERPKWTRPDKNLQLDDLVIIKEPTPPLKWSTARVIEVHPGDDGIVRVAKVKTSTGKVLTRPAVKLCPMPLRD
ncbi:unnamed protein product [Macrosiphum euphorbiae]|uniref:DUF5641 domain-containing protein n=1 Tax=Macrosiphum euphorbiae TaxID=13131 RepID=A0AAV0WIX3_9HEMI|nr:unnamed protein product [Macrosiphum euphorbiae]